MCSHLAGGPDLDVPPDRNPQFKPLCKRMWQFYKDLEPEIPFDPEIPLPGIYPKDYKSLYYKDACTHVAALFTIAKTWNQPKFPSIIDWIKKM